MLTFPLAGPLLFLHLESPLSFFLLPFSPTKTENSLHFSVFIGIFLSRFRYPSTPHSLSSPPFFLVPLPSCSALEYPHFSVLFRNIVRTLHGPEREATIRPVFSGSPVSTRSLRSFGLLVFCRAFWQMRMVAPLSFLSETVAEASRDLRVEKVSTCLVRGVDHNPAHRAGCSTNEILLAYWLSSRFKTPMRRWFSVFGVYRRSCSIKGHVPVTWCSISFVPPVSSH